MKRRSEKMSDVNYLELSGFANPGKKSSHKNPTIISLGDEPITTLRDEIRETYIELADSMATKRHLTGMVNGVEMINNMPVATVDYKKFKIYIPLHEFVDIPEDDEILGTSEQMKINYKAMLTGHRLWSIVDFVIKGIDEEARIATASRKEAMMRKVREYYLTPHLRTGAFKINEGAIVEARIVDTNPSFVTLEVFGLECSVGYNEASYTKIKSFQEDFKIGENILVKIIKLERVIEGKRASVRVEVSIKQAQEEERRHILESYKIASKYCGIVTCIEPYGYYVRIGGPNGNIDVLCTTRGLNVSPKLNSRVVVYVTKIDMKDLMMVGHIVHIS